MGVEVADYGFNRVAIRG